ncbi:MAG: hypothetical protein FWD83_06000 [Promicromonosporaceae bacterium]|nr:hypothetical protein [Promicromonosporaceae bacterium]
MSKHYSAVATREGRWWSIEIEGVGVTQARSLRAAPTVAAGMLSAVFDVDESEFTVDVIPRLDPAVSKHVHDARAAARDLAVQQQAVAAQSKQVAIELRQTGMSSNDVADVLGVSPQRVSQLIAGSTFARRRRATA